MVPSYVKYSGIGTEYGSVLYINVLHLHGSMDFETDGVLRRDRVLGRIVQ